MEIEIFRKGVLNSCRFLDQSVFVGGGCLVWVMDFPSSVARSSVENKIESQVSKSSFIVNK